MANQYSKTSIVSSYATRIPVITYHDNDNIDNNGNLQKYAYPKDNYQNTQNDFQNTPDDTPIFIDIDYSGGGDDTGAVSNSLMGQNQNPDYGVDIDPNYNDNSQINNDINSQINNDINSQTFTNGQTTSGNIPSFNSSITPTNNNNNQTLDEEAVFASSEDGKESDGSLHTVIIILSLVILALFSLSLIKLKNRGSDKEPVNEKSIYDKNKPLPLITQDIIERSNSKGQIINIQSNEDVNININNNMNNNYGIPDAMEYDQLQYGYDDRMSFLALGDSAIEPRQATLNLKEEVIKKSNDNMPIPLVHVSNENELKIDEESEISDEDEDNINLKAVEPLPGTVIPSKKVSPSGHSFLHDPHDLFRKVSKGVKNVGNKLKPNSISSSKSTISNSSKSSNDQSSNSHYSVLTTPKEQNNI